MWGNFIKNYKYYCNSQHNITFVINELTEAKKKIPKTELACRKYAIKLRKKLNSYSIVKIYNRDAFTTFQSLLKEYLDQSQETKKTEE